MPRFAMSLFFVHKNDDHHYLLLPQKHISGENNSEVFKLYLLSNGRYDTSLNAVCLDD